MPMTPDFPKIPDEVFAYHRALQKLVEQISGATQMPMTFLEAVASFEGYGRDPKNRPTRNHNPGNIEFGEFARRHGATRIEDIPEGYKSKPRYAYFPDAEMGFAAMKARFSTGMYEGLTVTAAIHKWAPPSENDTAAYVDYVCRKVGCTPETVIDGLL